MDHSGLLSSQRRILTKPVILKKGFACAFCSRAVPGKQGAKSFPVGTLLSPDLAQQDCTSAAVSRAACDHRGCSADLLP